MSETSILIVEDSEDDLRSYRRALQATGWQVCAASSMAEALVELRQRRIAAILLDYRLPDGDGLAFLRLLGAEFGPLPPPVVMLTGYGDEAVAAQAIKMGANDYLAKDVHQAHLQRLVWSLTRAMTEHQLRREKWDAAERLAASEQQYRLLFENSMDAILRAEPDGSIEAANEAACRMFGLSEAEIRQRGRAGLVDHSDPRLGQLLAQRDSLSQVQGNLRMRRGDGSSFEAEIKSSTYLDLDGRRVSNVVLRDITERLQAEARLRASEGRLAGIIETAMDAIIMVDASERILSMNPAARTIFRCSESQTRGQPISVLIPERFAAAHSGQLQAFVRSGVTSRRMGVRSSINARRWDGEEFPAEASISHALVEGEHLLVVILNDISLRRHAEYELQQLNETLEAQVQQRTAELGLALADAQTAVHSRGDFLAKMSHEIRTPMNAILGMTYLALKATHPTSKSHGYLQRIEASGKHLLQIINDILDFSKIDAGKLELELADFDLDQMIRRIVELNEARAHEKGLCLSIDLDPDVPRQLRGDALRLSQILINFVNNAIKFTNGGFIFLRVHRAPDLPGAGCALQFEVEDTGVGITREQQQRLFQSFEQGDNSTTRQYGGTGLGLAISKQLAQLMGGQIGVVSQPGVGSRFWFTALLQVAEPGASPLRPVPSASDPGQTLPQDTPQLFGARVMVVDDNGFNLDVAKAILEGAGVQVTLARDGARALELLQQESFDCVLMDVQMPVLDGIAATLQIRQDPRLAGLRVIAMTANALLEDRRRCLDAGMDDVLTKPVDPPLLFAVLSKWLRPAPDLSPPRQVLPAPAALEAMATLADWDAAVLARSVGSDPAVLRPLLERFLAGAREDVNAILHAATDGPAQRLAARAHRLKSSAQGAGALRLGTCCEALEQVSQQGDAQATRALAQELASAFARCETAIGDWLRIGMVKPLAP